MSPAKSKDRRGSVGMPEYIRLLEFGQMVWWAFGEPPYQVGSSISQKRWRDIDVRLMLSDEEYEAQGFGDPTQPYSSPKWVAMVRAYSALGREMTGLPIDFQIQQRTHANARFTGARNCLASLWLHKG